MRNLLGRTLHQSYFVVALCVGILVGTVLGLVFRVNFFASPVWVGFCVLLLVFAYLKPKVVFVVISLIAGMILAFFRVSSELMGENYIRQFYGAMVVVTGTVSGDPETDEGVTKIKLMDLKFGEENVATSGSLYISAQKNEEIARAD